MYEGKGTKSREDKEREGSGEGPTVMTGPGPPKW